MNQPLKSRSPWPIAIIAFFVAFALFLTSFIVWALGQKQDLVSENYYEHEVRYQEQLNRLNRTQPLAGVARVELDGTRKRIQIRLPAARAGEVQGSIHLYRPSNARLDRQIPLALDGRGEQTLAADSLAAGLWKVRVTWTANGADYFLDQPIVVAGPAAL